MWTIDEIADAAADGVTESDRCLREENAIRGLDTLDELELHPVLAGGIRAAGFGLLREHPMPSPSKHRSKISERERCDLVILPEPGLTLADPARRAAERENAEATLFAPAAADLVTPADTEPGEALWIEVKTTGQFAARDGVPMPNARYTTELVRSPAADIRKLARDPLIEHAASLIVLFAQSESIARHDLGRAVHRWLDNDLPIRSPTLRIVPIDDRIGNSVAAVCLTPVRPAGPA